MFEYNYWFTHHITDNSGNLYFKEYLNFLNDKGKDGWELVEILDDRAIFKRKVGTRGSD